MQYVHRPTGVPLVDPQDRRIEADFHAALAEADQRAQQRVGGGVGRCGEERESGDDQREREQDGRLGTPTLDKIASDVRGDKVRYGAGANDDSGRQVTPVEIRQDLRQRRADDRQRRAVQSEKRKDIEKQAAESRLISCTFLPPGRRRIWLAALRIPARSRASSRSWHKKRRRGKRSRRGYPLRESVKLRHCRPCACRADRARQATNSPAGNALTACDPCMDDALQY